MQFDAATVVFVAVCLIAAVGSQIQAKILLDLYETPLLISWIISIFFLLVGAAQWICRCQDATAETKRPQVSRLLLVVLHMADIVIFFIALNYSSVRLVAGMQVLFVVISVE